MSDATHRTSLEFEHRLAQAEVQAHEQMDANAELIEQLRGEVHQSCLERDNALADAARSKADVAATEAAVRDLTQELEMFRLKEQELLSSTSSKIERVEDDHRRSVGALSHSEQLRATAEDKILRLEVKLQESEDLRKGAEAKVVVLSNRVVELQRDVDIADRGKCEALARAAAAQVAAEAETKGAAAMASTAAEAFAETSGRRRAAEEIASMAATLAASVQGRADDMMTLVSEREAVESERDALQERVRQVTESLELSKLETHLAQQRVIELERQLGEAEQEASRRIAALEQQLDEVHETSVTHDEQFRHSNAEWAQRLQMEAETSERLRREVERVVEASGSAVQRADRLELALEAARKQAADAEATAAATGAENKILSQELKRVQAAAEKAAQDQDEMSRLSALEQWDRKQAERTHALDVETASSLVAQNTTLHERLSERDGDLARCRDQQHALKQQLDEAKLTLEREREEHQKAMDKVLKRLAVMSGSVLRVVQSAAGRSNEWSRVRSLSDKWNGGDDTTSSSEEENNERTATRSLNSQKKEVTQQHGGDSNSAKVCVECGGSGKVVARSCSRSDHAVASLHPCPQCATPAWR